MQQSPRRRTEVLFGRPSKRPSKAEVMVPGIILACVLHMVALDSDTSEIAWHWLALAGVPALAFIRSLYWYVELRELSDEAIIHQSGQRRHPAGYPGLPIVPSERGRWRDYRVVHKKGWQSLILLTVLAVIFGLVTAALAPSVWSRWALVPGLMALVFGLISLALAYASGHELLVLLRFQPTVIELSKHPIPLGEEVDVVVSQDGPVRLNRLEVTLRCEEVVSYRVGTNTKTDRETQHEERLCDATDVVVAREEPFVYETKLQLPRRAMHSLDLESNDVRWTLRIEGDVVNYPDFDYEVLLCVAPALPEAQTVYR